MSHKYFTDIQNNLNYPANYGFKEPNQKRFNKYSVVSENQCVN